LRNKPFRQKLLLSLRVTASIGMAECAAGEDSAQLVRRADDGVYASKKAGRNCSHWHNGIESIPINAPGKQPARDGCWLSTTT